MRTFMSEHGGYLWQCAICSKIVKSKSNLREHIEGQHQDNTLPCVLCGKLLKSKAALRMHMHRNHKQDPVASRYNS